MELPSTSTQSRGFTLIELLISIALVAIIATFGLLLSFDFYRGFSFLSEQRIIVSILEKARNQAMSNVCIGTCSDGKKHGVKFLSDKYVIFQGYNYSGRDISVDEEIKVSPTISLSGMDEVVFDQLSGKATVSGGDLNVTGNGKTSTVTVSANGRIDVQ